MDATNILKEITRVTAPVAWNTLSVNVFTAQKRLWSVSSQALGRSARRLGAIDTRKLPTATLKAQRAFLHDLCINVEGVGELGLS